MKRKVSHFAEYSRTQQYNIRKEYQRYRALHNNDNSESDESDTDCGVDIRKPFKRAVDHDNFRNNSMEIEDSETIQDDLIDDRNTDEEEEKNYFSATDDSESSESNVSETEENDEEHEDGDLCIKNARKPLYPGAPLTVGEHILSVLSLMLRFKTTGVLFAQILSLIELHCIKPNFCVKTWYKFQLIFRDIKSLLKRHYYCEMCHTKRENNDEVECSESKEITRCSYFIELSIISQLEQLYKRVGFKELLNHKFTRVKTNVDNIEDIYDGSVYKGLCDNGFLADSNNISLTWNTDGVPLYKSSKLSIWPLYFVINELPFVHRFKRENTIFAGLWFGAKTPATNLFMGAFRESLRELYKGVNLLLPNTESIRVRGIVRCGTCDLCAKAHFLNIKYFNGDYGCPNCKEKGKQVENVHIYPYKNNVEMRTTTESIEFAKEANRIKRDVYGIKGPTELSIIFYKYIETTAIDVMHCVYVGITKKLGTLWFDSEYHSNAFSLTQVQSIINKRIEAICPPNFVQRLPRTISDIAYWKASELKLFLLIYSLPILCDIMSEQYFNHHKLLVLAVYLLNKESVSNDMIEKSNQCLHEYVSRFSHLYGEKFMSCNVHLLLHLAEMVRRFGPLWTTSCFPFENMNGVIKSLVHGTKHAALQIYSSVSLFYNYSELKKKYLVPENVISSFCATMESKSRLKTEKISSNISIVGKTEKKLNLPESILYCFRNVELDENKVHIFHRLLINNMLFDSVSYNRKIKTKSNVIKYSKDGISGIGAILTFAKLCVCECKKPCNNCSENCASYAIINTYNTREAFYSDFSASYLPHIYLCTINYNVLIAIPVSDIQLILFQVNVDNNIYVIEPVNTIEIE